MSPFFLVLRLPLLLPPLFSSSKSAGPLLAKGLWLLEELSEVLLEVPEELEEESEAVLQRLAAAARHSSGFV